MILGEVGGKNRQFKTEGGKRPSGEFRAAFVRELCMEVEQFWEWIRTVASGIVRKFQTEVWRMQPEWLIYAGNEQLYIQLAVCQENEKV